MVTNYDGENIEFKEDLPLLPVRDIIVYPFMILPLFVGRESSIKAVEESLNRFDRLIFLCGQKDIKSEAPTPDEIFEIGTVAMIMRMRKLPDGRIKILIQGLSKARILSFNQTTPYFETKLAKVENVTDTQTDVAIEALMRNVREQLEKIISLGKMLSPDLLMVLEEIKDPGRLADLVASNLNLKVDEAQMILETLDPIERLHSINEILRRELEIIVMQLKIRSAANDEISKNQKEHFLREQIRAIKSELGDEHQPEVVDEFQELRDKVVKAEMPQEIEGETLKQLHRLEKMHPDSSESGILRTYLELMSDLPWNKESEEQLDLKHAKEILDEDHFDLEKVKDRILEHLAVKSLKGNEMKGPILCFAGPPGVGKTSLGKSIARSTGRKFARLSLGGMKDEAEIRGHRRTYVGAMPGRFIQSIKQVKSNNPVIVLDEIDKIGSDFRGDPSSALLEVLDPEQNHTFRDNYLNVPFDLSNVMFIATANDLEGIPAALRDRMEILHLSGYTQEDKVSIAQRYLVKKQLDENGLKPEHLEFTEKALEKVISNYTRESGLRNLERQIGSLCRKIAFKIANGDVEKYIITPEIVEKLLGPPHFIREDEKDFDEIGVATGLAYTAHGGEILYIETTKMKGKGLTLTGQLGDVMKESAQAAIGYIRSCATQLGIDEDIFDKYEIHVHLPAGAIPKDGPSAGITLATAIVSLLTDLPVSKDVAMTGEITLTGKVLPIGGLKEKSLAAMRMGIKNIVIPWKNKKDLVDIPENYRKELNFIPVKTFDEVLKLALIGWKPGIVKSVKKGRKKKKESGNKTPLAA